jgi:hypothetical protein
MFRQLHGVVQDVNGNRYRALEGGEYDPKNKVHLLKHDHNQSPFYVFSALPMATLTHQALLSSLDIIDGVICPHLKTINPHLSHRQKLTGECWRELGRYQPSAGHARCYHMINQTSITACSGQMSA